MINYAHLKSQMIQLLDLLRSILYPNVFDAMEEAHSKEELEAAAPASASGRSWSGSIGNPLNMTM